MTRLKPGDASRFSLNRSGKLVPLGTQVGVTGRYLGQRRFEFLQLVGSCLRLLTCSRCRIGVVRHVCQLALFPTEAFKRVIGFLFPVALPLKVALKLRQPVFQFLFAGFRALTFLI